MPSLSSKLKTGLAIAIVTAAPIVATGCTQLCGPGCGSKKEQVQKNGCGASKNNCGAAK